MSVIRQPGVLGRTTRRRVVGVGVAFVAAAVETLAVGVWFLLLVGSPSTSTALAGLGILFCGALVRTGLFGVATSELSELIKPWRLGAALAMTASWVVWLFVAQTVGGPVGLAAGTLVLGGALLVQFLFERYVFRLRPPARLELTPILSATLLAWAARRFSRRSGSSISPSSRHRFRSIPRPSSSESRPSRSPSSSGVLAFVAHQRRCQRLLRS